MVSIRQSFACPVLSASLTPPAGRLKSRPVCAHFIENRVANALPGRFLLTTLACMSDGLPQKARYAMMARSPLEILKGPETIQ